MRNSYQLMTNHAPRFAQYTGIASHTHKSAIHCDAYCREMAMPPSTRIPTPLTYRANLEHKKMIGSATSSGEPNLPRGTRRSWSPLIVLSSRCFSFIGVTIVPAHQPAFLSQTKAQHTRHDAITPYPIRSQRNSFTLH